MLKNLYFIILILFACSCTSDFKPLMGPPTMQKYIQGSPPGPPNFQLGWKEGCATATAATAVSFYKMFYTDFKKDYSNTDNDYNVGWSTGFWFCHRYFEVSNSYDGIL
jgi:hypothetical protein